MPTREKELVDYWLPRIALRKEFINEIAKKSEDDIGIDRVWEDMIFGWALGKGLSIPKASEFAEKSAYEIACAYPVKMKLKTICFMRSYNSSANGIRTTCTLKR